MDGLVEIGKATIQEELVKEAIGNTDMEEFDEEVLDSSGTANDNPKDWHPQ